MTLPQRISRHIFRHPDRFLATVGFAGGFIAGTVNAGLLWGGVFGIIWAFATLWLAHLDHPDEHHLPKE